MRPHAQELAHLVIQRGGFRNEIGWHRHIRDLEAVELARVAVGAADDFVHCAQKIFGMDHTNDVLVIVAIDRQARVVRLETLFQNCTRFVAGVDHLDIGPVKHDFLNRPVHQIKRAENAVTVFLFDQPLGVTEMQRACNLLSHGHDVAVWVDAHTENRQHPAHQ